MVLGLGAAHRLYVMAHSASVFSDVLLHTVMYSMWVKRGAAPKQQKSYLF